MFFTIQVQWHLLKVVGVTVIKKYQNNYKVFFIKFYLYLPHIKINFVNFCNVFKNDFYIKIKIKIYKNINKNTSVRAGISSSASATDKTAWFSGLCKSLSS